MYVLYLLFVSCCTSVLADPAVLEYTLEDADQYFEDFIVKYEKEYEDAKEKELRFQIFKDNIIEVNRKNKKSGSATYGITKFMDLTREEFRSMYLGLDVSLGDSSCQTLQDNDVPDANAPDSFDWRTQNIVTEVKDQQQCGSCYAFSSTGTIESQYAMKHKQIVSLSEQQIVDCVATTSKCAGGFPAFVFSWLIDNGGMQKEDDYPYEARNDTCRFDGSKVAVRLTNCYTYDLSTQEKVKQLLYKKGPISIAIDAESLPYLHGNAIYTDCTDAADHAVLLVGYGTEGNQPYWIVKNSWGSNWGDQGYFRMIRGEGNACGMMLTGHMASVDVE